MGLETRPNRAARHVVTIEKLIKVCKCLHVYNFYRILNFTSNY